MQNKYKAIAILATAAVLGQLTVACNCTPDKTMESQNIAPPLSSPAPTLFSPQVADDLDGYRAEFIRLVERSKSIRKR